ncbi:MAG: haloacid dehalogenase [Deltaproteobacteria bacterium]|jgi:uncharacterized HAD superfamily protein|nr:haloacid dehalogenase [Deltaproteobacteria bacterium]
MKIDPASVAFDIDGVVADTMTLFLDIARQEHDINSITYADITCYNLAECLDIDPKTIDAVVTRILDGNYNAPLNPIAGAPVVLFELGSRFGPVVFVTARPYAGPLEDWISQALHLDSAWIEIIATGSHEAKVGILQQRQIQYFVDDRLETCFLLEAAGIQPILFKQPWNREPHSFFEVGSWFELEKLLAL